MTGMGRLQPFRVAKIERSKGWKAIDFPDMWRHAATFVDKILRGTKPADLPVELATKFVTMVNLKAAKAIGVEVRATILAQADEVIT